MGRNTIIQCAIRKIDVLILGEINAKKHEISMYNISGYDRIHNLDEEGVVHGMLIYIKRERTIKTEVVRKQMIDRETSLNFSANLSNLASIQFLFLGNCLK